MNTLRYDSYASDGIFGTFTFDGESSPFMVTLAHAYQQQDGSYAPIVRPGVYDCVRGVHALEDGVPFETFEVTGVVGHTGLLFHPGNFNEDSRGCTLCGASIAKQSNGRRMITASRLTFGKWMARLAGVDQFKLQVL